LRRFGGATRQGYDIIVGRAAHRIARRIGIVRRPFSARALAKHAAEAEEDEHRQRQKDDGVDIEHVARSRSP